MRILCLDDEPLALKMLQLAVEKAKPEAEILTFSKQRELIAEAESGGCDVAFLDIHMRGMTGVEVAKTLKGINPKMNIILVQCFGNFDVFTPDGSHVHFERSRSKEIFAYLVHRRICGRDKRRM